MPRASKSTARAAKASPGTRKKVSEKKVSDKESQLEKLQVELEAARAERARAVRDLEAARLELSEQQRRSSQQQLVASEALKDARKDRDRLLMQLEVLRAETPGEPARHDAVLDPGQGERVRALEQAAATAQSDLTEARGRLAAAEATRASAEESVAKLRDAYARLESEKSQPPPVVQSQPPAPARPGFFRKLFGGGE